MPTTTVLGGIRLIAFSLFHMIQKGFQNKMRQSWEKGQENFFDLP